MDATVSGAAWTRCHCIYETLTRFVSIDARGQLRRSPKKASGMIHRRLRSSEEETCGERDAAAARWTPEGKTKIIVPRMMSS